MYTTCICTHVYIHTYVWFLELFQKSMSVDSIYQQPSFCGTLKAREIESPYGNLAVD